MAEMQALLDQDELEELKSQKFLERGSLLHVLLVKLLSLTIKGSPPALPYWVQMAKGLISS